MAAFLGPEKIDALYMSPQQRAIETAAPLAEVSGQTPNIVDGIAEYDLGHPTYIPGEESGPLTRSELDRLTTLLTGTSFQTRVHRSIGKIIADHPGETVAAVCHGGVISSVLADLLGVDPINYFNTNYTSVTRILASTNGRRSMASFNECHWLRQL